MKRITLALFVLLSFSALILTQTSDVNAQAKDFSEEQISHIKSIIEEYIDQNPDKIINSLDKHHVKKALDERNQAMNKIKEHNAFFESDDVPFMGNAKGDVTVIEFFDYNCGYCRRALTEVRRILKEDDKVRVVFVDTPILGPASYEAAKWSIASHKQGNDKYFEFHKALMNSSAPKNASNLEKIAKKAGLDVKKLKEDLKAETTTAHIEKIQKVTGDIGVRGTPAFIVGGNFYPGYINFEQMKKAIKEARSQ